MGQIAQNIIITTSHRASDQARSLCRTLEHVIPSSEYISRGSKNLVDITNIAIEHYAKYVYICESKGSSVSLILLYELVSDELMELDFHLKIHEYMDYKIFGWKKIPESGPLSLSRETRNDYPEIIDYLAKIFRVSIGEKTERWLLVDIKGSDTYLQFVDALTIKPFTHLRVQVIDRRRSE